MRRVCGAAVVMCGLIAGFAIAGTIPGLGPVGCLFELSACAAVSAAESQEAASDVGTYRITPVSDKYDRSAIAATGADIIEVGTDYVIVMALPGEVEAMRAMGFGVEGVELPLDFPDEDSDYHNFDEMVAEIEAVASAHSDIVKLFSIGQSYKGRELWTMKISDNPEVDESAEAAAYIMGGHHAREHLTVEMTLAAMNYLVDNYGTLQRVTDIVNNREVYITFNVNPDGSERDIEDDYYHYKRKNMQGVNGTDLNRNYSYNWGCCGGSSSWVYSETYRGASAFDAPETAAVRDFVEAHSNIKTSLSFHSYAELVMWPYGYTYTAIPSDMDPSDHARFVEMGEYMANSNGYTAGQSSDLYITDGDSDDWLYGERRILAFTFEMGGDSFYPGDEIIPTETAKNIESVLYLCEQAGVGYETPTPTITPTPASTPTGAPSQPTCTPTVIPADTPTTVPTPTASSVMDLASNKTVVETGDSLVMNLAISEPISNKGKIVMYVLVRTPQGGWFSFISDSRRSFNMKQGIKPAMSGTTIPSLDMPVLNQKIAGSLARGDYWFVSAVFHAGDRISLANWRSKAIYSSEVTITVR